MKIIKYKAYCESTECLMSWQELLDNIPDVIPFILSGELKSIKLLRFTGLYDVLGEEVYDGDILESDSIKFTDSHTIVIYDDGSCNLTQNEIDLQRLIIVGNSYENGKKD